jgi:hypothetical protein
VSTLGVALDDAALALARDGALAGVAPSIVDAGAGDAARAGEPATDRARRAPASVSSRHWADIARGAPPAAASRRLARAELRARLRDGGGAATDPAVQVAVPAAFGTGALSEVLAVCRAESLPVAGFVDAAALLGAALALRGTALVLEVGLHHAAVTRIDCNGTESRRRSARVRTSGGLLSLHESWLQLVSEAMVLRTRFDPLHEAASEQRLYELLPDAAARAAAEGVATLELPGGSGPLQVTLSRDQFAARGEGLYRDLVGMMHELRPAGAPVAVVADAAVAGLPGLREAMGEFAGCELLACAPGLAARAASLLPAPDVRDAARVPLLRGVPARDEPLPDAVAWRASLGREEADAARPTHLLWSGRALPLPVVESGVLEVGRSPAAGGVALADGLAGVSRLHCSLCREAGQVVLVDHSRHGTWINGERVAGRARLRAGDRVRIGDPGVELELISVGEGHGTAA